MVIKKVSDEPRCLSSEEDVLLVKDAPQLCHTCRAALCLRKQVINLSLGNTEEMLCLTCMSKENEQSPEEILKTVTFYILRRQCFAQEWQRYKSVDYCPDKDGCFPAACFRSNDKT